MPLLWPLTHEAAVVCVRKPPSRKSVKTSFLPNFVDLPNLLKFVNMHKRIVLILCMLTNFSQCVKLANQWRCRCLVFEQFGAPIEHLCEHYLVNVMNSAKNNRTFVWSQLPLTPAKPEIFLCNLHKNFQQCQQFLYKTQKFTFVQSAQKLSTSLVDFVHIAQREKSCAMCTKIINIARGFCAIRLNW